MALDYDGYWALYLTVVNDPRFRLYGLTRNEISRVKRAMDLHGATRIDDVLTPDPAPAEVSHG